MRALRLIQGALRLVCKYPKEAVLAVAQTATENRLFRYKDLRRLIEQRSSQQPPRRLCSENESIRPIAQYKLEDIQ